MNGFEGSGRSLHIIPMLTRLFAGEARRLRSKLEEYYESVGKDDSVFICYRTGSYVPFDTSAVYETTALRPIEHWVSFSLRN